MLFPENEKLKTWRLGCWTLHAAAILCMVLLVLISAPSWAVLH